MSAKCSCGCGKTVRLNNRRLSQWAYKATGTLDILRRVSLLLVRDHPPERRKIEILIEHGEQFIRIFYGIIHGTELAPTDPMGFRRHFEDWRRAAEEIADSHAEIMDSLRREHPDTSSQS